MIETVIVLAKQPVPGRVKTRLVPPLTHRQAADLAGAAIIDTLVAVAATGATRKVLAFDGCTQDWLRPGWTHTEQPPGELDVRLAAAFDATGSTPALLVGMDTPQITPELLAQFDAWRYDACVGPALDGGYWAIGFRDPRMAAPAILGVPMSTSHTCVDQLRRLTALGLRVQLLHELRDVDTIDDAEAVAALVPDSAFAAELARITETAA